MKEPLPEVSLAVVGVGHLGRQHARVASTLPGVRLQGVYDHHEGRAEEVAREFGVRVLPSLEAVAEQAAGVIIATPTASHAELAGYFLARGRDVLIEKPITVTLSDADALLARAREGGRIVQVGHVERYNPAVEAALSLVSAPRFIEVHRLSVFTPRSLDADVVRDLMIHDLQIVRCLVARPVAEVRAAGMPVLTPRIDIANARIRFEGGCVANFTASRVSEMKVRRCRVFDSSSYVSIDMQAQSVRALRFSAHQNVPAIVPTPVQVRCEEPLARELADFARAVRERAEPLVSGEVGREALALAELVLSGIEEHRRWAERDGR
ncbi:MAG TPA: Gfo/Idh/MocA family oxidoreductase [Thermoanaerobaculia bacterium]|nr:Gfo/Idh/MocA family oxidoreductase [Thermoanaerobaculia bacterium]